MAEIIFTSHLNRYLSCASQQVDAATLAEALQQVLADNQQLAGYIVDDQQRLRKNIAVFVDGQMLSDRVRLSDRLRPDSRVYVMQALSGG